MRLKEFQNTTEIFEESVTDQILDVATQGETAWSEPMSAEEAIAMILGKTPPKNLDKHGD
jgi:hypothetical protein